MGISTKMLRSGAISLMRHVVPVSAPHILIASTPKSASSFLGHAIEALPGMMRLRASQPGKRQDIVLDPVQLGRHQFDSYVIKRHVRFNSATAQMIQDFGLTPVVLTRDLADSVVSMRDFIRSGNYRMQMAWLEANHAELDNAELDRLVVDLMVPWYLNFIAGWRTCREALWYDYDDVREQPERVLSEIAAASGVRCREEDISGAVSSATKLGAAFNKGVPGRGDEMDVQARRRLERLLQHYPDIQMRPTSGRRAIA